jgi:hypothetical protein
VWVRVPPSAQRAGRHWATPRTVEPFPATLRGSAHGGYVQGFCRGWNQYGTTATVLLNSHAFDLSRVGEDLWESGLFRLEVVGGT